MPPALTRHRYGIMVSFIAISLTVFFITRCALLLQSLGMVDMSLTELLRIFAVGLVYDLATLAYISVPFVIYLTLIPERLYRTRLHKYISYTVFFACLYVLLFTAVAEWFFWEEFGARFNFISVDYLVYRREVAGNIYESYPLIRILLALCAASLVLTLLLRKHISTALQAGSSFGRRIVAGSMLLTLPVVAYAFLDQSQHEISANRYENELAGNGIYQFFNAFRDNELDYDQFYIVKDPHHMSARLKTDLAESNATYTGKADFDITRRIQTRGKPRRLNVMLVVVESLSAEFLGSFGNDEGLTPNLDRLAESGMLFTNFYATGTHTDRGLEAVSLSIPPTPGRSTVKRPDNAGHFSLGSVFRSLGYDTHFIYGGFGYFDNMNEFFSGNGFDIVDRSDLSEDEIHFSNIWGVSDDDLFARVLKEADKSHASGAPFMSLVMTTSNHRPYTYPDGVIDIPSGVGRRGAVKYTDHAIGAFIDAAKSHAWFRDTLFVIVADHCAGSAGKTALPAERYRIPLIIYSPDHVKPARIATLSSQIDVAPTILDILNVSYTSRFFGRSILRMQAAEGRALIGTYQRLGLLENGELTVLSPQQRADRVTDPLGKTVVTALQPADPAIDDAVAYYEAASYMKRKHLDLWTPQLADKGAMTPRP